MVDNTESILPDADTCREINQQADNDFEALTEERIAGEDAEYQRLAQIEDCHAKGMAAARALQDFFRHAGPDHMEGFVAGFCDEHRTNQQRFFGRILELVRRYAGNSTDGRNEFSVGVAKDMVAAADVKMYGTNTFPYV